MSAESNERALWLAVIEQAITDARYTGPRQTLITESEAARNWIFESNRDFILVCDFLGLEADGVREVARREIADAVGQDTERRQSGRPRKTHDHDGRSLTITEWAKHLGVSTATIHQRLNKNLPKAQVFAPRMRKRRQETFEEAA